MKRFLLLLSVLFLTCASVLAGESKSLAGTGEIPLNLQENPDLIASRILYAFILKEEGLENSSAVKKGIITRENTFADYVDLNNDGISEIVGYSTSQYKSKKGRPFYILKKEGDEYIKIDFVLKIDPNKPVSLLRDRHRGFSSIRVWDFKGNQPITVKYDGTHYSIMRL